MSRLFEKYKTSIVSTLNKNYKNIHQVPKLDKVVVNVGAGEAIQNIKCLDYIQDYLKDIKKNFILSYILMHIKLIFPFVYLG